MNKQELLKKYKNFAVIGVTEDQSKYSYKIFERLLSLDYTVVGISPKYKEVLNQKLFTSLEETNQPIDIVVFVVNPKYAYDYVNEMRNMGIKYAWMQPGTIDKKLKEYMNTIGIEAIEGCILIETDDMIKHL